MTEVGTDREIRVGALRPNQLLHTYGVGAMADLPNLSVVMLGLDYWNLERSRTVQEERLLAAVRAKLGNQVDTLRLPPYLPETGDPFAEWTRVGVPVGLFPGWLRCTNCGRLGRVGDGLFYRLDNVVRPEQTRFVHDCRGKGYGRPVAVPARFVLACADGHLDDFPWLYFVHRGGHPGPGHSLKMSETGSTGEAADVFVTCDQDGCASRPMSEAFGDAAEQNLPACRGRHPHLGTFSECARQTRTLVLGATNSWFPMQLRAITLPRAKNPIDHLVAEYAEQLQLLAALDETTAKRLMPTQTCWPQLEPYGPDAVWQALKRHSAADDSAEEAVEDLRTPEWKAFTDAETINLPDFTTKHEGVPQTAKKWLDRVVLVPRLREVAALYGFTRIDAPEWDVQDTPSDRSAPLSSADPSWVPCAEMRGEGIFLRFNEERVATWERNPEARKRERTVLVPAFKKWCQQRRLPDNDWPGLRYVLLHTVAHVLIRELALESGYSAAGIGERIYATDGSAPMAGILLYTAAPDSEGTLGGLVSLGSKERLGQLIERALDAATRCSSDPLCSEHDPTTHGRLHGAACHACLFASETSCERGNHFLDRALLVDTLAHSGLAFFTGAAVSRRAPRTP
ncbi:DrmB family protein [Saccharopolyspora sp. NPDC000995]